MMVIVMGVCGCGKTTVGRALAHRLQVEFLDADDFHPPANVAKMAAGVALTDDDRGPWLDRLAAEMREREAQGRGAVVACSALKEAYRRRLERGADDVRVVYLKGDAAIIAPRSFTYATGSGTKPSPPSPCPTSRLPRSSASGPTTSSTSTLTTISSSMP